MSVSIGDELARLLRQDLPSDIFGSNYADLTEDKLLETIADAAAQSNIIIIPGHQLSRDELHPNSPQCR